MNSSFSQTIISCHRPSKFPVCTLLPLTLPPACTKKLLLAPRDWTPPGPQEGGRRRDLDPRSPHHAAVTSRGQSPGAPARSLRPTARGFCLRGNVGTLLFRAKMHVFFLSFVPSSPSLCLSFLHLLCVCVFSSLVFISDFRCTRSS